MTRRAVGLVVLGVWVLVLGWHLRREHFPDRAERLARGAAVLAPGDTYYAVLAGDRPVGWARSSVDTIPGEPGFRLEARLEITAGAGSGTLPRVSLRTESRLDSLLSLRSFAVRGSGPMGEVSVRGRMVEEGLLEAVSEGPAGPDTLRVRLEDPVVPPAALPLRLAASRRLAVGRSVRVEVFDPLRMAPATVRLDVTGRELRSFADSAVSRGPGRGWVAVRRDTVTAWEISQELGPLSLTSWIGPDGRLVEARVGETLRLQRTAFELAYYPVSGREDAAGTPTAEEPR